MLELEYCPFCGGEPKYYERSECEGFHEYWTYYYVECKDCGAQQSSWRSKNEVIKKWNRRYGGG